MVFMISFDVESLFTNIPVDETIDLSVKIIYKKKSKSTDLFHGFMIIKWIQNQLIQSLNFV